jgi:hypothetical protein
MRTEEFEIVMARNALHRFLWIPGYQGPDSFFNITEFPDLRFVELSYRSHRFSLLLRARVFQEITRCNTRVSSLEMPWPESSGQLAKQASSLKRLLQPEYQRHQNPCIQNRQGCPDIRVDLK